MTTANLSAQDIIARLMLIPHPEGGWYRESWRSPAAAGERAAGTAIYYLLEQGQRSHWHRVDADEIWHFYAGAPLTLSLAAEQTGPARDQLLGPDLSRDQRPQITVPAHHWQAAHSTGAYTLVGCTVSPGFEFDGFEMAPPGFDIPRA